jgi:hypothetical protein
MSALNGDGDLELTASDPDDINRQRRLLQINDARETVINVRNSVGDPTSSVASNTYQRNTLLFAAVQSYAIELEPLFEQAGAIGKEFLRGGGDEALGVVEASPPRAAVQTHQQHQRRAVGSPPGRKRRRVSSLQQFITLESPVRFAWEVAVSNGGGSITQETFTSEVSVPMAVSNAAYRRCNRFLSEVGLDIDITGDEWKSEEPGA